MVAQLLFVAVALLLAAAAFALALVWVSGRRPVFIFVAAVFLLLTALHATTLFSLRLFGVPGRFESWAALLGVVITAITLLGAGKLYSRVSSLSRVERNLQESEARYRDLVERAGIGIMRDTSDGRIVYANETAARLFGYDLEEFKRQSMYTLVHPDDRERVLGYHRARCAGEPAPAQYEFKALRRDGSMAYLSLHAVPIREGQAIVGTHSYFWDVTEQRQAQAAQAAAEARYRSLFEGVPVGLYRTTPDGRILDANPALAQMLGYPNRDALISVSVLDLYADPKARREQLHLLEQNGILYNSELQLRRKDGSLIWVRDAARAVRGPDGAVLYYEGSLEDITEAKFAARRQAVAYRITEAAAHADNVEELSRRIHEALNEVLAAKNFFIALCDARHEWLHFPYLADETLPGSPRLRQGPWPAAKSMTAYVIQRGQALLLREEEIGKLAESGEVNPRGAIPAAWLGAPLRGGSDQEIIGVVAVQSYTDPNAYSLADLELLEFVSSQIAVVIERTRAASALRESEGRYRTTINSLSDAIHVINQDRQIVLANQALQDWMRKLGLSPDVVGKNLFEAFPFLSPQVRDEYDQVFYSGQPLITEDSTLIGDKEFYTETRKIPVLEGGTVVRVVTAIRDISERKQAEKIAQRLEQQERLAAVGQLAAGIAHDFNNLLTGIIGLASLLGSDPELPPRMKPDLEAIAQEGQRGAQLVRQILDFTRHSPRVPQNLSLSDLLPELAELWRRTLPEHVHLDLAIGPGDLVVDADPTQIKQMLTNLVLNARDAMPEGGVLRVALELVQITEADRPEPEMRPGKWVKITVSDTGTGMTPEVLSHLYEPFFTTKGPGKGTGLGLAQVYGIVQQHEGHITVDTQLGRGTTFTIYFPARERVSERAAVTTKEGTPSGHGEAILVVEDEAIVLQTTKTILTSLGYRVFAATNGQEALQLYDQHRQEVALVLSDVVMPGMGGYELCQRLRERNPSLKLLLTSGYPLGEDASVGKPPPQVGWIQKPFSRGELAKAVYQALSGT